MKEPEFTKWSGFTKEEYELVKMRQSDLTPEQVEVRDKAIDRVTAAMPLNDARLAAIVVEPDGSLWPQRRRLPGEPMFRHGDPKPTL